MQKINFIPAFFHTILHLKISKESWNLIDQEHFDPQLQNKKFCLTWDLRRNINSKMKFQILKNSNLEQLLTLFAQNWTNENFLEKSTSISFELQ